MAEGLTPEEWADPVAGNEGNKLGCGHSHPKGVAYLRKRFREAMAQAHAEGLEAAARECDIAAQERFDNSARGAAARIRSLIPAGQPSGDAK